VHEALIQSVFSLVKEKPKGRERPLYKSFVGEFVRVRTILNVCSDFWVLGLILE